MQKHLARILMAAALFALMVAANLTAQVQQRLPMGNSPQKTTTSTPNQNGNHANAERNPACQKIVQECKNLGFIVGEWKQDNGLWKDCYDPVVHGGQATRDGKPIQVPVSQTEIQSCRGGARTNTTNTNPNRTPMH